MVMVMENRDGAGAGDGNGDGEGDGDGDGDGETYVQFPLYKLRTRYSLGMKQLESFPIVQPTPTRR